MKRRHQLIRAITLIEALVCAYYDPARDTWLIVLHDRLCRELRALDTDSGAGRAAA